MDIESLRKNYATKQTEDLLRLLNNLESLEPDAISVLEEELNYRGLKDEAEKIDFFFEEEKQKIVEEVAIQKEVEFEEQNVYALMGSFLNNGDSLELAWHHLKEKDINLFQLLNNKPQSDKMLSEYVHKLKDQGYEQSAIDDHLSNIYMGLEQLKMELGKKGFANVVLGNIFLILGTLLFLANLVSSGRSLPIHLAIGFLAIGIVFRSRGVKQRKF